MIQHDGLTMRHIVLRVLALPQALILPFNPCSNQGFDLNVKLAVSARTQDILKLNVKAKE
jgi:hypothetical protein